MSEQEQAQEASHTGQHSLNAPGAQRTEGIAKSQLEPKDLPAREPIRFLVADDNKVMRKLVTRLMERSGHSCDFAVNGEEAVEAYKKGHQAYQCILMDVSMPVMGGTEAMKLIRKFEEENSLKPGYIVALIAGMRLPWDRDRMRKLGFTTALRKPFHLEDLNGILEELGLVRGG